jgi:hypothetical protein
MNLAAIKKIEIAKELGFVPVYALDKIKTYIKSLLKESDSIVQNDRSLHGIWKNKGFEKITDLEADIREARKQMSDSILKREF